MTRYLLITLLLFLASCQPAASRQGTTGPAVTIKDPWARPAKAGTMGMTSAVYFVVVNEGPDADALIGAATDVAGRVELHETRRRGDVMEMSPVSEVEVPPRSRVTFQPGGLHVMLMDLKRDLKVGDSFSLTLRFRKAGDIKITVTVREGGM